MEKIRAVYGTCPHTARCMPRRAHRAMSVPMSSSRAPLLEPSFGFLKGVLRRYSCCGKQQGHTEQKCCNLETAWHDRMIQYSPRVFKKEPHLFGFRHGLTIERRNGRITSFYGQ